MRTVYSLLLLVLLCSCCAIGSMIDDAVEEIEGAIGDLHASECMRYCAMTAEACVNHANGWCIDSCKIAKNICTLNPSTCEDSFVSCVQECSDEASACLFGDGVGGAPGFADCTSECVRELEDALKAIDLRQ